MGNGRLREFILKTILALFLLFHVNESRLSPVKTIPPQQRPSLLNKGLEPNQDQFSEPPITFAESVIAGGVARLVAQIILHPLDSMRTRAQIVANELNPNIGTDRSKFPLLRGIVPQLICSGPAGSLQFGVLEVLSI
jgi:hypothetical protein